ncbi:MAG: diguanylate cyclase, partial [Thiovulaceae bacterium]|nr:diguanylate cyclase [Sulfurimonadaceae bacterium]
MKFPLIKDVASTDVIHVDITDSISKAMDVMIEHNHRNVIVKDAQRYKILTVTDVLKIQNDDFDLNLPLKSLSLEIIPTILVDANILDTIEYLNNPMEYICAVNEDNSLYGLVTHTDITSHIDPHTLMDNYRLIDFLKIGRKMKIVSKDTFISNILSDIIDGSSDHVLVVDDMKPVGILTTKDLMLLIKQKEKLNVEVSTFMSSPVESIDKNASIKEALEFINKKHYKRVVVVDEDGKVISVISQKDLISLTYSKWATLVKEYQEELREINSMLANKTIEYETIASTDNLTGLYNRYKFSELYNSTYTSMIQRHNSMSLILIDIDNFKSVNDTFGHNIGDKALVNVSRTLSGALRNIDIIARWGGEEFIVLLPTADLNRAVKIAEDLRVEIELLKVDIIGHVSVSLGVAEVQEGEEMSDVIH